MNDNYGSWSEDEDGGDDSPQEWTFIPTYNSDVMHKVTTHNPSDFLPYCPLHSFLHQVKNLVKRCTPKNPAYGHTALFFYHQALREAKVSP